MVMDLSTKTVVAFTDDDEDDYFIFSEAIASISNNIEPVYLKSCDDLLHYLQQHTPDLIILDVHLRGTSGIECIKQIRSKHSSKTLPIVIQSTEASQDVIAQCMTYGANHYLAKLGDFALVQAQLRELLNREW
jgi:DNA-binding response OmpR family regulator